MKRKILYSLLVMQLLISGSCKKDWLEEKRDINVIVPTTLKDLRLLLNYNPIWVNDARGVVEVASDDFTCLLSTFQSLTVVQEPRILTWQKNVFQGVDVVNEWNDSYQQIEYANIILDALEKITMNEGNKQEYMSVKGGALYYRSNALLNLVTVFAKQYDVTTATSDPGVPIRLSSGINQKITRASVAEVYKRITEDLSNAALYLPSDHSVITDPSKGLAYGLLARCYLIMGDYAAARTAASASLLYQNYLIDFNTLNAANAYPVTYLNNEIAIPVNLTRQYATPLLNNGVVVPELYNLYDINDLRKSIYYKVRPDNEVGYRGSYNGGIQMFSGIATDEVLLIRAECAARANDITASMNDLNTLLIKRYKTGTFVPKIATSSDAALKLVLIERRKELVRRALRWTDIRRLNKETRFANALTRTIGPNSYTLPPNDPRFVFQIPDYVIEANGIDQNP